MANRRMFSLSVTDTDAFLELPASAQCLYFHLGMHADDDGFIGSPRKITVMANCAPDDLKLLIAKGFIIPFESGICVVRDWKINNYIQKDRYQPTRYRQEKCLLETGADGAYLLLDTTCIQTVSEMDAQDRIVKDRIVKDRKELESEGGKPQKRKRFSPPTVEEVKAYCSENGCTVDAERFVSYYESQGWHVGRNPMKDWRAAIRNWASKDQKKGALPTDYGNPEDFYK